MTDLFNNHISNKVKRANRLKRRNEDKRKHHRAATASPQTDDNARDAIGQYDSRNATQRILDSFQPK